MNGVTTYSDEYQVNQNIFMNDLCEQNSCNSIGTLADGDDNYKNERL